MAQNFYAQALQATQQEPAFGKPMVQNNAGGYVFQVSPETKLDRFLILGSEAGSYYCGAREMTLDNARAVVEMIEREGVYVVQRTVEISQSGRAPKNNPALFVLALCFAVGDEDTKNAAKEALPAVARTATHFFLFLQYATGMRGWGRALKTAVAKWYEGKDARALAYQLVKYKHREGWRHHDVLNLAHVRSRNREKQELFKMVVDDGQARMDRGSLLNLIERRGSRNEMSAPEYYLLGRNTSVLTSGELTSAIQKFELPHEVIPSKAMTEPDTWRALLKADMPVTALIRSIARMAALPGSQKERDRRVFEIRKHNEIIEERNRGIKEHNAVIGRYNRNIEDQIAIESAKAMKLALAKVGVTDGGNTIQTLNDSLQPYLPYLQRIKLKSIQLNAAKSFLDSAEIKILRAALTDPVRLTKGRVHPLHLLTAWKTYASGHGHKGNLIWEVDGRIRDILEDAFYLSFKTAEPTGKRIFIGLDVSGSMGSDAWNGLTAMEISAVMCMAVVRSEPDCIVKAFSHELCNVNFGKNSSLNEVLRKIQSISMGATDCALPMIYAREHKIPVDAFIVYTDNETWYGRVHPFQALKDYRKAMGIDAKLIVVGITATGFSIADPADAGMLDVVGFDSAAPQIIGDFIRQ